MPKINQETISDDYRKKVLEVNFEDRYEALDLPGYNEGNLPIKYYNVDYEIDQKDANVYIAGTNTLADYNARIAIYNLLYYSKEKPVNSDIFIPIHQIKKVANHTQSFKNHALAPFAKAFDGKTDLLLEASKKLGFTSIPTSDVGFLAKPFSCIQIQFLFWDGDDEFPAGANILFDENILDFTCEESVLGIAMDGVKKLISFII